ncbi:MAG: DUF952 domain-containing protein [Pseudomonadota bacterium]
MADQKNIYKILNSDDWAMAQVNGVSRTALDEGDGYVHLSTRAQVGETLQLHYAGAEEVRLLEYDLSVLEGMGNLRWEPSRGGDLFPHLYGSLQIDGAARTWTLLLSEDGIPQLPKDL